MQSTTPKFDQLPTEVLRRIISLSTCEAALALLRVSTRLHRLCNDRLVFKSIIENRPEGKVPTWQCPPLSIDAPTSTWARYALADSKAVAQTTRPWIEGFPSWAPQLMVLHRMSNYVFDSLSLPI